MLQNLCDTHTHTLYSKHAYSTIEEDVRAAAEGGLELIGITDHFSRLTAPVFDVRSYQYFINLHIVPKEWHGVQVMCGAEADIVDIDGNLFGHDIWVDEDITGDKREKPANFFRYATFDCDYIIASLHSRTIAKEASKAQATQMYIGAINHPRVLMLGHIGRSGANFELKPVIEAAKSLNKLIEINEHSFGFDESRVQVPCKDIAIACAEAGVSVAVNTDAHISADVAKFDNALAMLEEIHFPQELIATRSAVAFKAALSQAL